MHNFCVYGLGVQGLGFRLAYLGFRISAVTLYCWESLFCRFLVELPKLSRVAPSGYRLWLRVYGFGLVVKGSDGLRRVPSVFTRLLGLFRFPFICVPVESSLCRIWASATVAIIATHHLSCNFAFLRSNVPICLLFHCLLGPSLLSAPRMRSLFWCLTLTTWPLRRRQSQTEFNDDTVVRHVRFNWTWHVLP